MTELNPPLHLQNRSDHTAQGDRLLLRSLWRVGGVGQSGDLLVAAQGSPNMSVTVAAGAAIIPGTESAFQGTYHCVNDASKTVTIAASDPSNGRKDLIVAKVQDQAYSGATNAWSLVAVTGTPSGSPVPPAAPANSITLATITVNANATSITNANIVNNTTQARRTDNVWQQVAAGSLYQWYNSSGTLLGELDASGHFKSLGTTGGATKVRKPMVKVVQTSGTILNNTATKVPFAAAGVIFDTDGMFSDANDWIVINTAGIYKIRGQIDLTAVTGAGVRQLGIMVNNSFIQVTDTVPFAGTTVGVDVAQIEMTIPCSVADFFYIQAFQNSGFPMSINSGPGFEGAVLEAYWIGPLS